MDIVKKKERKQWFYSYNMIFDLEISHQAKLIYIYLCRCADSESQSYPSKKTIAEKCSISVSAVKNAIRELQKEKLLIKKDRYRENGSQASNLYVVYDSPYEDENGNDNDKDIRHKKRELDKNRKEKSTGEGIKCDPRSKYNPLGGQNKPTPRSESVHLEGLPNIRTTHKEGQSVSQSIDMDNSVENEIQELERIKEQCELHIFKQDDRNMIKNALEMMYFAESLKVENSRIPKPMVRSRMYQLNGAILSYALNKLKLNFKNTESVTKSIRYVMSTIYNAINEYHCDTAVDPELNRIRCTDNCIDGEDH